MQRFNTALKPIYPARLALATQRIPPRRARNLNGFFDVLDLGGWLDEGKNVLRGRLEDMRNGDGNAHIAAQNYAGDQLNTISRQYALYKNAGTLTVDLISRAQGAIQGVIDNFTAIAREVGSSRAMQGAADIAFYGRAAIQDMERDKSTISGNPYFPPSGGGSGFPDFPGPGTDYSSYAPLLLGGAALLIIPALLRRRSKT